MAVPELPRAQGTSGPQAYKVPGDVLTRLVCRKAVAESEPKWALTFMLPCSLEPAPRHRAPQTPFFNSRN